MSREQIEIGSVPCDEDCQQYGTDHYDPYMARAECNALKRQLIRKFGNPPGTVSLVIRGVPPEVVVRFDEKDRVGLDYALLLEGECPDRWDIEAAKEIANAKRGREKEKISMAVQRQLEEEGSEF